MNRRQAILGSIAAVVGSQLPGVERVEEYVLPFEVYPSGGEYRLCIRHTIWFVGDKVVRHDSVPVWKRTLAPEPAGP